MKLNIESSKSRLLLVLFIVFAIAFSFGIFYLSESDMGVSNVQVTNVASNSASIVWETEEKTSGEILISKEDKWKFLEPMFSTKDTFYDDRNLIELEDGSFEYSSELKKDRTIHHVTIRNLEPETEYYFRIKGVLKAFKADGVASFTTLKVPNSISAPETIYGQVKSHDIDTEDPTDGVVLWEIFNDELEAISNKYSSIISDDGGWSGDLNNVFNSSGEKVENINTNKIDLEAIVPESSGVANFTLDEYKPTGDIFVNVFYLPEIE